MAVDRLEVLGVDLVPGDAIVVVEADGEVADDVLDELGVVVGLLGDELFVGALEHGVDGRAGRGLEVRHHVLDPECGLAFAGACLEADLGFDLAALVVGAVLADLLRARAEAGRRGGDAHHEVIHVIGAALEGHLVVHQAGLLGDGRELLDEVGEAGLEVGFLGVEALADGAGEFGDAVGRDGFAGVVVEDLEEPAHVRALLVVGQGDVHVDGGDGGLLAAVGGAEADRINDVLDADAVDRDVALVLRGLHVDHRLAADRFLGGVGRLRCVVR